MWSNIIFQLCILLSTIIYSDCGNKYCRSDVCKNSQQHTLCKFQSPGPARHCLDYERTVSSDKTKQALLDKINSRRNKVASGEIRSLPSAQDMLKMSWNEELEESAQRWADQCVTHRHSSGDVLDACRDLEDMQVGQNIATVYGEAPGLTPMSLVDVWYMELLNVNASMMSRFSSSNQTGLSSYKYFTQLVWAESMQVGCGGVKFKVNVYFVLFRESKVLNLFEIGAAVRPRKGNNPTDKVTVTFIERFEDSDDRKNRTVYRLVCNFAPRGNQEAKPVYRAGLSSAKCIYGTCKKYTSLCITKPIVLHRTVKYTKDREILNLTRNPKTIPTHHKNTVTATMGPDKAPTTTTEAVAASELDQDNDNATFDFFSYLYGSKKQQNLELSTPKISKCHKDMAVDEIFEFLKKRLREDPTLKELFSTSLPVSTASPFTDASVAAFLDRIYSKTALTTMTETASADFVNSTLLVNLVEAVIFRNTDNYQHTKEAIQEIQLRPNFMNAVRVQPEVVEVTPNYDITGHYFFPEDDIAGTISEPTAPDYDISYAPSMQDVVLEIEELKKNRPTRDFLYDILETELVMESTTKANMLSPDDMNLHTSGYSNMRIFLKEIAEKSESNKDDRLVGL